MVCDDNDQPRQFIDSTTSQFENSGNEFVVREERLIGHELPEITPTTCDALEASSSDGHYSSGLPESEPASIRWLNRRKAFAMTSSVSSSHTHSCAASQTAAICRVRNRTNE
jgi:hypothetical protein